MINLERVGLVPDDYWYDLEYMVVQTQVELLSPDEWPEFERECVKAPPETQERVAYVLVGIESAASARILLRLCKSPESDTGPATNCPRRCPQGTALATMGFALKNPHTKSTCSTSSVPMLLSLWNHAGLGVLCTLSA